MPTINQNASKLIDEYIGGAPDFARPICEKLRAIVHKADGDVIEDWKWGPNFNKNGMICGFGHFKAHVKLAFFKGALLKDPAKLLTQGEGNSHSRGVKFTSSSEIDERSLISYVREAIALNSSGIKAPARKAMIPVPAEFKKALAGHPKARGGFEGLTPGYRNEYVEWIVNAKRLETRAKRIESALAKLAKGESLNAKYRPK